MWRGEGKALQLVMADTQIKNWRRWQKHLVSHPLVVSFSLRPHPWLNSDGTLDFHRMCIPVVLGRKLSDEEMERYNLPRLIEGYPVQYRHPGIFPPRKPFALLGDSGSLAFLRDGTPVGLIFAIFGGKTYICKAKNIEELLEVSFTPPIGTEAPPQYDSTKIPKDPCERFDVLVSGISVGHRLVTAGTLGTFVWDKKTGGILGLTCAHIAAPPGAKIGDAIYQPGPLDIRTRFGREPAEQDICGHLLRWYEISTSKTNKIDAAVFKLTRPALPDYVLGHGKRELKKPY